MESERFLRLKELIGKENYKKLKSAKVLLFGLGGVGGFVAECLARTGVGTIGLVDGDTVEESNFNRQLIAVDGSCGSFKSDLWYIRIKSINHNCSIDSYNFFYKPDTYDQINFEDYDYIIDAIDDVESKVEIIERAKRFNKKVISCMGTAKLINADIVVCDISKTHDCPLAKAVRLNLKKRGIEKGVPSVLAIGEDRVKGVSLGSLIFVPTLAGNKIASQVVEWILNE